jgi:hypothetical protein
MKILSNKDEIINYFESIYEEIINENDMKISDLTKCIRDKMQRIGAKMFEIWFNENIGSGYSGTKITKQINDKKEVLRFHGHLDRTYLCCLGYVNLKRSYYKNKNHNCFPIEENHKWLKDEFMPDIKELSCFLTMLEPYDMAKEILKKVGNISISSFTLQKITKSTSNILVKNEDELLESKKSYIPKNNPELLVISTDGAKINTDEGWKEVKSGAVYQVKKNKSNELTAYNKTYVSRIENYKTFGKRLYTESRKRGVSFAKEVVTIGDGAKWIWDLFGKYYPNSVEIVDWYHATEHLWDIIDLLYGSRTSEAGKLFEKKCEDLLYAGLIYLLRDTILDKINELKIREKTSRYKLIIKEINYFIKNEKRMKYEHFEEMNYPIGSGVIEGACKHLVQIRMKRNGMKWSVKGAHGILQLRCLYLSDRWGEVEDVIEKEYA